MIGDIRDREALTEASVGVDSLFHLAALKHVPVCEDQPNEAFKTNVLGTKHVIDVAIKEGVKNVIYISTDKAVDPTNFYGLTKAMGEKLIIHANQIQSNTKFVCIRGGNVLGTNGSVVPIFKQQIAEKSKIILTNENMTRFFLTLEDAIKLIFKAVAESIGGEIFVMKMPSCKITELAAVLIDASGKEDVKFDVSGIRPGEKLHEVLFSENESRRTVYYDDEYFVILPTLEIKGLKDYYSHYENVDLLKYSSSAASMTKAEIKEMLMKGGFI